MYMAINYIALQGLLIVCSSFTVKRSDPEVFAYKSQYKLDIFLITLYFSTDTGKRIHF